MRRVRSFANGKSPAVIMNSTLITVCRNWRSTSPEYATSGGSPVEALLQHNVLRQRRHVLRDVDVRSGSIAAARGTPAREEFALALRGTAQHLFFPAVIDAGAVASARVLRFEVEAFAEELAQGDDFARREQADAITQIKFWRKIFSDRERGAAKCVVVADAAIETVGFATSATRVAGRYTEDARKSRLD